MRPICSITLGLGIIAVNLVPSPIKGKVRMGVK